MCGYHVVIEGDGKAAKSRAETRVPAANRGYNARSLTVCVTGNNTVPEDRWTAAQIRTLGIITAVWANRWPEAILCGHRDLPGAATLCPGLDVRELLGLSPLVDT